VASRKISEMIGLTRDNNLFPQCFPHELLIAIFWEETLFQNIEQVRGAEGKKGLGFGQVQEDTLPLIKVRMGKAFPRSTITADDAMSVQVASYALESFRRGFKSGSPEVAYKVGYAGATADQKNQVLDGRTRGQIANAVWQSSLDLASCGWDNRAGVRAALMRARPASSSILDAILDGGQ
jgi:hypothetical protein